LFSSVLLLCFFQAAPPQRAQLNLAGQTDAAAGESRRNENQQFNLIDTNTVKDLNLRMGTTATIVPEFRPDSGYFGTEYGGAPQAGVHSRPAPPKTRARAELRYGHMNSIFSACSFFQAGGVKPARENEYGFRAAVPFRTAFLTFDGRQQKVRGQVNGNVLVPLPNERIPLIHDPALRSIVERFIRGYPNVPPNRADVDPRMLNTNAPQRIDTDALSGRLDAPLNSRNRLAL